MSLSSEDIENKLKEVDDKSVTKLTNWEKEPTVIDLKQDFSDAKPSHDAHVSKVKVWLDNLNMTGLAKIAKREGRSSIAPKLIRKQAEWRYASLSEPFLSTNDIFNTDPVTYEDKKAAIQNGLLLNHQFNTQLNKVNFVDEFVRTVVDEGTVVVKTVWDEEEGEVEVEVPVYEYIVSRDPLAIKEFEQIHRIMQENPLNFEGLPLEIQELHLRSMEANAPLERIQVGVKTELQTQVLKNQPYLEISDFRNLIIDPTAQGNMDKANFVINSFESSLSELKLDGKYKNLEKINVEHSSILSEPDHETTDSLDFNFKDEPRKKIVIYEYWGYRDIHDDGLLTAIVAAWAGDVMIRMEENPFPDKKPPFVVVSYLPVRRSNYGEPDGELLEENQKIIGAVTRGIIDIVGRSANGQVGMRKDALDVPNKRRFDKGLDYEFNPGINPSELVYTHTYPEIPRSAEYILQTQNTEAESMTGVKSFANNGITGESLGATATGIRSALDATAKRELGILRRLAEGIKQIGIKIISMNGEFLSDEEIIRITNEPVVSMERSAFTTVRRDELSGKFDLTLTISTPEVDNEKAQEIAFMMQTLGNTLPQDFTQLLLTDIARLRKMPELAKKIEAYESTPDPLAVKEQELKIALLEAQVFNEQNKGLENEQDIKLKAAKTRKLNSESDTEDLNYLRKEAGTDQEETLEQKDHDRATELDLKTADALFADNDPKKNGELPPNSSGVL